MKAPRWIAACALAAAIGTVVYLAIPGGRHNAGDAAPGRPGPVTARGVTSTGPAPATTSSPVLGAWQRLEDGLELGVFVSTRPSDIGDSRIRILRIDPAKWSLRLLNASAPGQGQALTARQWCDRGGLTAAINASMYRTDHKTSTSFMRTGGHTNNPDRTKDKMALAWDPVDPNRSTVHMADLEAEDFQAVSRRYGTLVQSIRMVTAAGKNAWSQQPRKWSAAAIGMDGRGRVLFIHVRSPYTMHDLIDILLALPIDLKTAQYCEGGPEAQMYVRSGQTQLECVGSYETGFENDSSDKAWPVPNVVGIMPRASRASKP